MIRAILRYVRDRHMNRAFAQIEQHTRATDGPGELMLTPAMAFEAQVFDTWAEGAEQRLDARQTLRPIRQRSARKGQETKWRLAHAG